MAHDRSEPHRTLHKTQDWQQLVSDGDQSLYQDETGEATSKAMMDIFNTHGSPEVILSDRGHEHWNKVWMNEPTRPSRLPWASPLTGTRNSSVQASTEYGREPQLLTEYFQITETPPDVVEDVEPDHNALEDHLQTRTEKDVRLNIDKAQEKQKSTGGESRGPSASTSGRMTWLGRRKKGRGDLGNLAALPPSWGHHPLRLPRWKPTIFSSWSSWTEVSHPPEPVSSDQSDSLCSESKGYQLKSAPVLQDLVVLPNTQTWIHLMSSITNHPPTFHYIIYSY
ncbi:hypothetical protein J4Q44_G00272900 [Coregonus suidteri]|uniref:Uncharacterized protein n=1 Tax=Coregonus suidteri TaxID=861788 RepID=A0AAN8LBT9_9TELE